MKAVNKDLLEHLLNSQIKAVKLYLEKNKELPPSVATVLFEDGNIRHLPIMTNDLEVKEKCAVMLRAVASLPYVDAISILLNGWFIRRVAEETTLPSDMERPSLATDKKSCIVFSIQTRTGSKNIMYEEKEVDGKKILEENEEFSKGAPAILGRFSNLFLTEKDLN